MDAYTPTPDDVAAVVATTAGEGANQPPLAQQWIASTILNRSRITGQTPAEIARSEAYEGAGNPVAAKAIPGSPLYNQVSSNILPVLQNGPVTTATHFINHDLQAEDGRKTPAWATGDDGVKVGAHTFYDRADQLPTPAAPSEDDLAQDYQKSKTGGQSTAAPSMPYDQQYGVVRNPDGSIYGLPSGVSVQLPGQPSVTTPSTDPDRIAKFLAEHPEDIGNHITPSDDQLQADYQKAQPPAPVAPVAAPLPKPHVAGGGDPGAPKDALSGLARGADTFVRQLSNAVTGGFADKGEAGIDALLASRGDLSKVGPQYSANMNALEQRNEADRREMPLAYWGGTVPGVVGQAFLLPEAKVAGLVGRISSGMRQGAVLAATDAFGHARGNLRQEAESAVVPTIAGAALGGAFGGVVGPRAKRAHTALSSYAKVRVDPSLAVNGGRGVQQVAQALKGIPIVGAPLAHAAARTSEQLSDAAKSVATAFGNSENAYEAGGAAQRGAEAAKTRFGAMKDALYGPVNALERNTTPVPLANTQRDIADLFAKYPTIPGWLEKNAPVLANVRDTLNQAKGHLTFGELKAMRTDIGAMIKDGFNVGGVDQARLKVLYGAMSRDMEAGAQQLGGNTAYEAMKRANTYNRAVQDRIESTLKSVIGDNVRPEQAYAKIVGAASKGPTSNLALLSRLKRTLPAEEWQEVGASVIFNMGRDGSNFSPAKFGTAWGKLSDEGKRLLFGSKIDDLDAIAEVAKDQVKAEKFYNHSNSGHVATMAATAGEVATGFTVPGGLHKVGAMVALAAVGRGAAELLASPGFARMVLKSGGKPSAMASALDAYAAANPRVAPLVLQFKTKMLNVANAASAGGLEDRTRTPALHMSR